MWGVKTSLRRRPGTFLHLVQVEERQLSVVSRSENFESWDAEMEREVRRLMCLVHGKLSGCQLPGTGQGSHTRGGDSQRPVFWQRTSRVCFGEWPVSWHLICESVEVYVSSSLEGFSQKTKSMSSILTQNDGILWKHCAEGAPYSFSGMCKT